MKLFRLLQDQQPRLVMFDLDGTLADSVPDLASAIDNMLIDLGYPAAGQERVRTWVGNGAQMLVKRALDVAQGNLPGDTDANQSTGDEPSRFDQAFQLFIEHYHTSNGLQSRLYEGVRELFSNLKHRGIKVAVVTNKPHQFTAPLLEKLSLESDFTLSGDSLPVKKPDPEPLLHCARHFNIEPQDCVMVGDSRNDVEAGKRAGITVVAVSYGYNHGEPVASANPDYLVDSLLELV